MSTLAVTCFDDATVKAANVRRATVRRPAPLTFTVSYSDRILLYASMLQFSPASKNMDTDLDDGTLTDRSLNFVCPQSIDTSTLTKLSPFTTTFQPFLGCGNCSIP
jgi:hypothetical protein